MVKWISSDHHGTWLDLCIPEERGIEDSADEMMNLINVSRAKGWLERSGREGYLRREY